MAKNKFTKYVMTINQQIDIKFTAYDRYGVTSDGRVFNLQTQRELKRCLIGTTQGYCLNGKFKSLKVIRKDLKRIIINDLPF